MTGTSEEEQYIDLEEYKTDLFASDVDYLFRHFVEPWLGQNDHGANLELCILEDFKYHINNNISGVEFCDNAGSKYFIYG